MTCRDSGGHGLIAVGYGPRWPDPPSVPGRDFAPPNPFPPGHPAAVDEVKRARELRRELGRELKARRQAAGLSKPQLASRATYSRSTIATLGSAAVARIGRRFPAITRSMRRPAWWFPARWRSAASG